MVLRINGSKLDGTKIILKKCWLNLFHSAIALIHNGSAYAKGPFIPVNCSAVPSELAESAFFGAMRGAFTGTVNDRKGYFELAEGDTLFLDEIGEMPWFLQAKLLRVLENKKIWPVGGIQPKSVNIRVIAATNANLLEMIEAGKFRQDLYFRIAGCWLQVPSLRNRKEDIDLLIKHFLNQLASKTLSQSALTALENYDFPGNVRELKNIIERARLYCDGKTIQPEHLHLLATIPNNLLTSTSVLSSVQVDQALGTDEEKVLLFVNNHGYINNALYTFSIYCNVFFFKILYHSFIESFTYLVKTYCFTKLSLQKKGILFPLGNGITSVSSSR